MRSRERKRQRRRYHSNFSIAPSAYFVRVRYQLASASLSPGAQEARSASFLTMTDFASWRAAQSESISILEVVTG